MSRISARKARLKDVPAIVVMWKKFMKEHEGIVSKSNRELKQHYAMKKNAASLFSRHLERCVMSKNAVAFVAEADGKVVGYCLGLLKKNIIPLFAIKNLGYITDIFVMKEHRKSGVSTLLKEELMKWFREKGIRYATMMVNPANKTAYAIYKKWGFRDYHLEMRKKI